jgi:hypothetical protein
MPHRYPPPPTPEELGLIVPGAVGGRRSGDELAKMKKFRFQLLAGWIAERFPPCTVADVGGGKGLLAWLLLEAGFRAEVIDPVDQPLPSRYRDLAGGRRVRLGTDAVVPRRRTAFRPELGRRYDPLVALHAHGANLAVLETAAAAGSSCVVLPCCVVGQPPRPGAGAVRPQLPRPVARLRRPRLPAGRFLEGFSPGQGGHRGALAVHRGVEGGRQAEAGRGRA